MSIFGKKKEDFTESRRTIKLSPEEIQKVMQGDYLVFAYDTDVGRQRKHNEDNYLLMNLNSSLTLESDEEMIASTLDKGILLMVTDGMGGAAAGDVASQMVRDSMESWFRKNWCEKIPDNDEFPTVLQGGIKTANRDVFRAAMKNSKYNGMGATITASVIIENELFIAQVGDSRLYLVRDNDFIQVTKDQSLVSKLVEAGNITKEEARHHLAKNVILQAVGVSERVEVGFYTLSLQSNDKILLCSDGLTDMVLDEKIFEIIQTSANTTTAVKRLVQEANNSGGKDNITIILASYNRASDTEKTDGPDTVDFTSPEDDVLEKTSRYIVPPADSEIQ
ncbi:MAG: Stp1/IreP family PP2C-type Ser/Thr phosphatase [Acidobacteria bacterium]|nr:Stp1/IreP family PP2C-type Ser/Thr phosphatase [Acidobacteriota bacterium]